MASTARNMIPATVDPRGVAGPSDSTRPMGSSTQKRCVNRLGNTRNCAGRGVFFNRSIRLRIGHVDQHAFQLGLLDRVDHALLLGLGDQKAGAVQNGIGGVGALQRHLRLGRGTSRMTCASMGMRRNWHRSAFT
jgi:hypothetical protein